MSSTPTALFILERTPSNDRGGHDTQLTAKACPRVSRKLDFSQQGQQQPQDDGVHLYPFHFSLRCLPFFCSFPPLLLSPLFRTAARPCQNPECNGHLPPTAVSYRKYCSDPECQRKRQRGFEKKRRALKRQEQQQMRAKAEQKRLKEEAAAEGGQGTCSVCLGEYTAPAMVPCGHVFCSECIEKSL